MALNFPTSPSNGQVYGDYTYNSSKGAWLLTEVVIPVVTTDDNPPANPRDGDMWMYSGDGTVFVYYQDVDGGQWIQTSGVGVEPKTDNLPAGAVIMWAAAIAPTNWLICDGSLVDRATWPSLFASIGTTYNTGGESVSQFRLPNLKGRVAVGRDASQTEFDVLGETGGAKTHTLTVAEMPSHTHIQDAHTHIQDAHNHRSRRGYGYQGSGNWTATDNENTGAAFNQSNEATTATNQYTTATNQNTGGGGAHNNLQPYIVLNYIIKATAGLTSGDTSMETRVGTLETASSSPIQLNGQTLATSYTIPVGYNGLSAGPITIADGVTITIPDGSAWSVV